MPLPYVYRYRISKRVHERASPSFKFCRRSLLREIQREAPTYRGNLFIGRKLWLFAAIRIRLLVFSLSS